VNASFEEPYLNGYRSTEIEHQGTHYLEFFYNPAGGSSPNCPTACPNLGWTFSEYSGVQRNGSAFSSNIVAPDGFQTAFLQTYLPDPASFHATISQSFLVSEQSDLGFAFSVAKRPYGGNQTIDLLFDGSVIGSYFTTDTFTDYFTVVTGVSAGTHTVTFMATNLTNAWDSTALLDNVRIQPNVSAVPLPASVFLIIPPILCAISARRHQS
jgi:hypothetical protein